MMANFVLAARRPEAHRRVDRRRRRLAGRGGGTALGADRCDLQPRSGHDDAGARRRHQDRVRHARRRRSTTRCSADRCRRRCLYAPVPFIEKNPNTVQALTNAIVRANKWIQAAGPGEIIKTVPESYLLGDRARVHRRLPQERRAHLAGWHDSRRRAADRAAGAGERRPAIATAKIDLQGRYTNDFVRKANAKYPRPEASPRRSRHAPGRPALSLEGITCTFVFAGRPVAALHGRA